MQTSSASRLTRRLAVTAFALLALAVTPQAQTVTLNVGDRAPVFQGASDTGARGAAATTSAGASSSSTSTPPR